jgi:spectinomycin phosphotransferase
MLADPGLDSTALRNALRTAWGTEAASLAFVPGYDPQAAAYLVETDDGPRFLKVRFGAVHEPALDVPAALLDAGVPNIVAPLRTRAGALWFADGERSLVVYPFARGRSAVDARMTENQWRTFGSTLRAVHDSGLERRFAGTLPTDAFDPTAGSDAKTALALAESTPPPSSAADRYANLLRQHAPRIGAMVERFEALGRRLRGRAFERVVCHADIHAANILVTDEDRIWLVDWDGPMIAPRERDLLFVIGSRIARDVQAHEEAWFFDGYGGAVLDPDAIIYYRYERILEDIAAFTASILRDPSETETTRDAQASLVAGFFGPGGIIETAEEVSLPDTG